MKSTAYFTRIILTHLEQRASVDPLFAQSFANLDKHIDDWCLCKVIHKHHCVGSYHSKEDSLILSACIEW